MSKLFGRRTPPQSQSSGGKLGVMSTDRMQAQAHQPSATLGGAEHRLFVDTYFTQIPVPGKEIPTIYSGDRLWARVTLTLETAGPVAVGNQSNLVPVLSGSGQLLETDVPMTFVVAKGDRLFVAATGINRIKRVIEPFPWLENITAILTNIAASVGGVVGQAVQALRSKV